MKMPWQDKTGLAKAATVLVVILLISLGLCGANFVAVLGFVGVNEGGSSGASKQALSGVLTVAGVLELAGIALSLCGLVVVGILAVVKSFGSGGPPPPVSDGGE